MDKDQLKLLQQRWQALASGYCSDSTIIEAYWKDILNRYQEPHRAFHTVNHLQYIFNELHTVECTDSMNFSVWYHDIIYKPGSNKNKKNSAIYATAALNHLSVPKNIQHNVKIMIEATQLHHSEDNQTQLFLDADMAILGSSSAQYSQYLKALKREFNSIPKVLYNRGRKRFIMQTLSAEKIFNSDYFGQRYEQQARENLTNEMARIQAR